VVRVVPATGWGGEVAVARRLGRWQQLLVNALAEHATVVVQAVVENHLGRFSLKKVCATRGIFASGRHHFRY
jgi:hypothetical protein